MRILIEGGDVVAFDGQQQRLLKGATVVLDGDRVSYVGPPRPAEADVTLDAKGKLVTPGFVNVHSHAGTQALGRLILDKGRGSLFGAGYLNLVPGRGQVIPQEDAQLAATLTLVELIRWGSTTAVVMAERPEVAEALVEAAGVLGVRVYVGTSYRSAEYYRDSDGLICYDWNEREGLAALARARSFIKKHHGSHNGRIRGILLPGQVDTCSPRLLRQTKEAADELDVAVQIHTAQNLLEFHEILRRYGKTPVEYLADLDLLGPRTILGHAVFLSGHSWTRYHGRDLELIADSESSVAHCPFAFARRGMPVESFSRYRRAGINVALGTDTFPRDIIHEMRWASLLCKTAEGDVTAATADEVFRAATLGGAQALGRHDLGRLAEGAKADIVITEIRKLHIGPVADPIESLVNCALGGDVEAVVIDGRVVAENGRVLGVDEANLVRQAQDAAERLWARVGAAG